jgi:hypothetical protein
VGDSVIVTITVQDSFTKESVLFAKVFVDWKYHASSDLNGEAKVILPKGTHYFDVCCVGYVSHWGKLTLTSDTQFLVSLAPEIETYKNNITVISTGGPKILMEEKLHLNIKVLLNLSQPKTRNSRPATKPYPSK